MPVVFSQDYITRDSTDYIPLSARIYYGTNLDQSFQIKDPIMRHRRLHLIDEHSQEGCFYGNMGSQVIPWQQQYTFYTSQRIGREAQMLYTFQPDNIPQFITNKPLSEIDFIFFGNGNEEIKGRISQNLSKYWNLGLGVRRSNNKGAFLRQENTTNNAYLTLLYQKARWRSNLIWAYNDHKQSENGGTTVSVYDVLPVGQWINALPRLTNANNQYKGWHVAWKNRILISPEKKDTTIKDSLILAPIQSPLYLDLTTSYSNDRQFYEDQSGSSFLRSYYGELSTDSTQNSLSSKHNLARVEHLSELTYKLRDDLSISAYHTVSNNTLDAGRSIFTRELNIENVIMGFGGRLNAKLTNQLSLSGHAYKSISGYTSRDFLMQGQLNWTNKSITLQWLTKYSQQLPGTWHQHTAATKYQRDWNLETENILENSFSIRSPRSTWGLSIQSFMADQFLTYDLSYRPSQLTNNYIQVSGYQAWNFGILHCPTEFVVQNSIVPHAFVRQTIAYKNALFGKHLNMILGLDATMNFMQKSMLFHPFWGRTIYDANAADTKFYPKLDFFVTMRIHKVHLSLLFDNIGASFLNSGTSYTDRAPISPNAFYLRMSWLFTD